MKYGKRWISLLLAALLVLALLPVSVFAAPPKEGCTGSSYGGSTTQHKWAILSDTATCTESGRRVWICMKCGQTYSEASTMKGHSWDMGRVTVHPTCIAPGIKTYTCSVCQKTLEEAIPAFGHNPVYVSGMAATCTEPGFTDGQRCSRCGIFLVPQQTIPALGHDWDEGVIVTEPEGFTAGVKTYTCRRNASHVFTEEMPVAMSVFSWLHGVDFSSISMHSLVPLTITEQPQGGAVTRDGSETVTLHVAASGGIGDYTYQWYSVNASAESFSAWNRAINVGENAPDFEAGTPGRKYFCRVTDEAGNTVTSEYAVIDLKLGIALQPVNANLQPGGKAVLSCAAEDGSGSYTYTWYKAEGDIEAAAGSKAEIAEAGDYYCIVKDDVTGETAKSEVASVYSAEPFTLAAFPEDAEYLKGTSVTLKASFSGGVEPYEIRWDRDGESVASTETKTGSKTDSAVKIADTGVYTVNAVDAMGSVVTSSCCFTAPELTIREQPEGGSIPEGGSLPLYVQVEDGEGPYYYTLYRNGEEYARGETNSAERYSFSVWYPGEYCFHIEDSKGRMIDSDAVTCENAGLRIKTQPEPTSVTKPGGKAKLSAEAESGAEPYTYIWYYKRHNTRYRTGDGSTISAGNPGEYICRVVDADGNTVHSKAIQVGYTGDMPLITVQPESGILKGGVLELSCEAVSGSGGELRYEWEINAAAAGSPAKWQIASFPGISSRKYTAETTGSYRCRITDTGTGKFTYTHVVTAANELKATAEVQAASADGKTGDAEAHIKISGGVAPYTVKIYSSAGIFSEDGRRTGERTVLCKSFVVSTPEKAEDVYYSYTPYQEVRVKENGEWKWYIDYLIDVYAVITDAEGTSATVSLK